MRYCRDFGGRWSRPGSWRIGAVHLSGAEPSYGPTKKGRAPAQLSGGAAAIYYYDLDQRGIVKLSPDLSHEEVELADAVCSPIHASNRVYCGCVEGIFDVSASTHKPRVLSTNRPGSITDVVSSPERVVWTVDLGENQLAVESLAASDDVP